MCLDWGLLRNFNHQTHLANQRTDRQRTAEPLLSEPGPDSRIPGYGIVLVRQSQRGQCGNSFIATMASPVLAAPVNDQQPCTPQPCHRPLVSSSRTQHLLTSLNTHHCVSVIYHLTDATKMPNSLYPLCLYLQGRGCSADSLGVAGGDA